MNPDRRIDRKVLVDNPWHRYCKDRYRHADGSEGVYYYVDMPGSCGIIPLFEDGTTVLVQCYRYLLDATLWEFPIGGMKPGEEPLPVAQKELEEEAGLVANRWDYLGGCATYKGISNERTHFFLARDLRWTEQSLEPSEEITVHRMPIAEARDNLVAGELPDGMSIAGLALYDRFVLENPTSG